MGSPFIDLTGRKFGFLTVVRYVGWIPGHTVWECRCDCGEYCRARSQNLRKGKHRSCGCGGAFVADPAAPKTPVYRDLAQRAWG